jgi:hypothetical protein
MEPVILGLPKSDTVPIERQRYKGYHDVISDMTDIAVTATLHVISVRSETFGKGGQEKHNSGSGTQVTKFQKIDLLVSSSLNLKQKKAAYWEYMPCGRSDAQNHPSTALDNLDAI